MTVNQRSDRQSVQRYSSSHRSKLPKHFFSLQKNTGRQRKFGLLVLKTIKFGTFTELKAFINPTEKKNGGKKLSAKNQVVLSESLIAKKRLEQNKIYSYNKVKKFKAANLSLEKVKNKKMPKKVIARTDTTKLHIPSLEIQNCF